MNRIREILKIAVREQSNGNDTMFLYFGREGKGKSTLLLDNIDEIDNLQGKVTPITHVGMNISGLVDALDNSNVGDQVALDEGKELDSTRSMERVSKDITMGYTVIRKKCLITHIAFTNPAKLQSYFSVDRVKGVFLIRKRGEAWFYNASYFSFILEEIRKMKTKSINTFFKYTPKFKDSFPVYTGRLKDDYERMKDENVQDVITWLRERHGSKVRRYSLRKAAEYLKVSTGYVTKMIRTGSLLAEHNLKGTHYKIREDELIKFKANFKEDSNSKAVKIKEF